MDDPNRFYRLNEAGEEELERELVTIRSRRRAIEHAEREARTAKQAAKNAKAYSLADQQQLADRFKELEAEIGEADDEEEIAVLKAEREQVSRKLADWLRRKYPNSFRVFEFNGDGQPVEESFVGINPVKKLGMPGKPLQPKFAAIVNKYGLKQDDIVIFHPTATRRRIDILFMTDDSHASSGHISTMRHYPETMLPAINALGLTPKAAQHLYFPKGGYPLFAANTRI